MSNLAKINSGLLYGRDPIINPFVSGDQSHWDSPDVSKYNIYVGTNELVVALGTSGLSQ